MTPPNIGFRSLPAYDKRIQDACRNPGTRRAVAMRKYPLELLNEALKLAQEIGVTRAAKQLNINYNTLKEHAFISRLEKNKGGLKTTNRANNEKYTLAQKQGCVKLALTFQENTNEPLHKCFTRAGQQMGVNGRSVMQQWQRGFFKV